MRYGRTAVLYSCTRLSREASTTRDALDFDHISINN
eukprot:SAG22_NODE_16914_length_315_cov_0.527778_1_plen_35_part_01